MVLEDLAGAREKTGKKHNGICKYKAPQGESGCTDNTVPKRKMHTCTQPMANDSRTCALRKVDWSRRKGALQKNKTKKRNLNLQIQQVSSQCEF